MWMAARIWGKFTFMYSKDELLNTTEWNIM